MIGERLNDLRKDMGLSQSELGEKLNINKHSISSYERNKSEPPDDLKILMAKFFNVSLDYLLGITDIPNSYSSNTRFLKLPKDFPLDKKGELQRYVRYLMYLHKEEQNNTK